MKKCPQCNSVFDDALVYCADDGTLLVEENLVLPSESSPLSEEETLVRHKTVKVEIPFTEKPTEEFAHSAAQTEKVIPVVFEKQRNTGKYLLFLITGLILGGGLVLAAFLFAFAIYRDRPLPESNSDVRANSAEENRRNAPAETRETAGEKHAKSTDSPDENFNGRVITLNAYVRSSPDRGSNEIDILPVDDRLDIVRRERADSPWYFINCEHGTSGWMHGNTIEFTR